MIKAVDIKAELAGLPVLRERSANTSADEVQAAFAVLAPFRDGSIFAGRFSGETPWERHQKGDELVQVLDGAATLTIMTDDGPRSFALTAGMFIVVPQGHWRTREKHPSDARIEGWPSSKAGGRTVPASRRRPI
jgi:quercetin dioxygenase-like cupin family protein